MPDRQTLAGSLSRKPLLTPSRGLVFQPTAPHQAETNAQDTCDAEDTHNLKV